MKSFWKVLLKIIFLNLRLDQFTLYEYLFPYSLEKAYKENQVLLGCPILTGPFENIHLEVWVSLSPAPGTPKYTTKVDHNNFRKTL